MKITKAKLKQIIREELSETYSGEPEEEILNEIDPSIMDPSVVAAAQAIIDAAAKIGIDFVLPATALAVALKAGQESLEKILKK